MGLRRAINGRLCLYEKALMINRKSISVGISFHNVIQSEPVSGKTSTFSKHWQCANAGPISIIRVDKKTWENNVQDEKYRSFSYNINGWFVVIEIGLVPVSPLRSAVNPHVNIIQSLIEFEWKTSNLGPVACLSPPTWPTVGIIFKISQVLS